ncbi:MAG: hypothetical protein HQ541_07110, partial [Mariniphaga sp.]|nr:hypothetical protein [Mariniphaga sp.]
MRTNSNKYLWVLIPTLVSIFLVDMVYFGKIPLASDTISYKPISEWVKNYSLENSNIPHWYPNLFGGMPSYGSYICTSGDPLAKIRNFLLFNRGLKYWDFFTIGGLAIYLLLRRRHIGKLSALFGGLVTCLTPYLFGLINAGHSTKIMSLGYFPLLFLAADYCITERKIRGILLLGLIAALQLWANHPQIVYYSWMVVVFFWLWNLVADRISKTQTVRQDTMASLMLVGGLILALVLVSDPYISVYEFQEYSNRGASSVLDESGTTDSGVKWDYATQWSFEPKELISFLYPYYYGMQNYPTRDIKSAAYWGGMPFTQSTHYFGLLVVLLAILGAVLKKPDRFNLFLWVTSGLILLVGFGSYFPILFGPLFHLAPFFNKFRVPSMIYSFLPLTIGILAAGGLDHLLKLITNEKSTALRKLKKSVLIIFGGFIGLTLIYLLFGNSIIAFIKPTEAGQYDPRVIAQI